jgi:hypothetical protein
MDDGAHQEVLRINQDTPLLAFDFLAQVLTVRIGAGHSISADFTLCLSMIAAAPRTILPGLAF